MGIATEYYEVSMFYFKKIIENLFQENRRKLFKSDLEFKNSFLVRPSQ